MRFKRSKGGGRPITRLTATQQQIYDLLKMRPRSATELIAAVWWVHPLDAPQISAIKAHIHQMNAKLCYRGERIRADRFLGKYIIVSVIPHASQKRKPSRADDARQMEGTQSAGPARLDRRSGRVVE